MADRPVASNPTTPPLPAGGGSIAEQDFRGQAEADPARFEPWYQLGLLALREGRHAAAVECLGKAVAIDPSQAPLHHYLASSFQALGQKAEAVEHFHRVVFLKPEVAEAHNNLGIALAQQGRRPEAIAAFAQSLRLKPDFPEAHNNWGIALVEQGNAAEAVERFRAALALHPNYPEGHNNLGLALGRLGRPADGLASFREAVRLRPGYADAILNLANLHRDLGKPEEAAEDYRRVLQARPEHREARQQLALVLARVGRLEDAIACLHQSLLFHPEVAETYNHLGILLSHRDRLDEAAASFRNALRLKSDHAEALNNLGNTLLRQQKAEEAIGCFRRALELRRDYAQPYCNLGSALLQQGKAEEAVGHYLEALRLQPDYADAHFNLGNAYRTLGRSGEAVSCYERVLHLQPENAGARLNLGVALSEQGHLDEAVEIYKEVLRRDPNHAPAYNSMGVTRLHQGRVADALAHFDEGLRLKPDDAEMHLNRALSWLLTGDYEAGWVEYEWRWRLKKAMPPPYAQPPWDGSPMPEGTVLLWAEQGLGDTLQFARYAALVKERVGRVLLDCPGPLRGLLASCPGIDALAGGGAELPPIDAQASLMSLPRILGTTLPGVPASVPYLFADATLREGWREKLGSAEGLKVGINWQGNPQFAGDRYRSIPAVLFRALADVPGVRLFSLQKGKGGEQFAALSAEVSIADLGSQITGDFRDTAAAMMNLDLIVSVDTSVAHLAGALGVPVWVLLPFNPDWRWLLGREDSVWYPSARLFRQSRWGDWEEVFTRLVEALREAARHPAARRSAVPLDLLELWERAVGRESRGLGNECWAALRQAGVPQSEEAIGLATSLRAAQEAIEEVDEEMQALESAPDLDGRAADLVRRYARARRERAAALAGFSARLASGTGAMP